MGRAVGRKERQACSSCAVQTVWLAAQGALVFSSLCVSAGSLGTFCKQIACAI